MLILGTFFFLHVANVERFNRNKWLELHNYHALPSPSSNHIARRYQHYRNFIRISIVWHECLSAQAIQYGHNHLRISQLFIFISDSHFVSKTFLFSAFAQFSLFVSPPLLSLPSLFFFHPIVNCQSRMKMPHIKSIVFDIRKEWGFCVSWLALHVCMDKRVVVCLNGFQNAASLFRQRS